MGLYAYLEQFRGDESAPDEQTLRVILDMLEEEDTAWDFPTLHQYVIAAARKFGMDVTAELTALTRRVIMMWYAEAEEK